MDDEYRRWIEPERAKSAIRYMLSKVLSVPVNNLEDVQGKRDAQRTTTAFIAMGAAVAFFVVVIGVMACFAEPVEGKKPDYVGLSVLIVVVVGGAGAGTFFICGSNNQKRAARDAAFDELCQRVPTMRSGQHAEFEGDCVGTVPWFLSEEWKHSYGLAAGEYDGDGLLVVECTHVLDPVLSTTDSQIMQGLSHLVAKKHQRLHLRAMEAVVFIEPLDNVSDLVFVPQMDASRAYYKRALNSQDCDLAHIYKLPRGLQARYWMAAAAPEECAELFGTRLPEILKQRRWCIVQVVGGHCVVITKQWHGNQPGQAPKTEAAITENIEYAREIFHELKEFGRRASAAETAAEAAGSDGATAAARPAVQRRGSRRPHSLFAKLFLFGVGIPLFLFGTLGALAFWTTIVQGRSSLKWKEVDAVVTASSVEVSEGGRFRPAVSYEYDVEDQTYKSDRIQIGAVYSTDDKPKVERTLAGYPKDAQVQAFYHPLRHEKAVLVRGLENKSKTYGLLAFSSVIAGAGLVMCVFGAVGRRRAD